MLRATWDSWGMLATALTALGGVVGIIYCLRPMPDLLESAMKAAAPEEPVVGENGDALPTAIVLIALVVGLGLVPNLAWLLAR